MAVSWYFLHHPFQDFISLAIDCDICGDAFTIINTKKTFS